MEESTFHPLDYVAVLRRRIWWFVTPVMVCIVTGLALAMLLPRQYTSSATVVVTAPTLSTDIVHGSSLGLNERARAMSQQLVSRTVLERVVREEGLADGTDVYAAADLLRARVSVVPAITLGQKNPRTGSDAFIVSYGDAVPQTAQRVADRLVNVFVDEHSKSREARAEVTADFLAAQLRQSETRLNDLEQRLRRAKESHIGRLPEQTSANLQMLAGLRQQLDSNAIAMRGEQDRLSIIERQIQEMIQGAAAPVGSRAPEPDTSTGATVISLEQRLAAARMTYTDKHPEVTRLQEELAAAKARAAVDQQKPIEDRQQMLRLNPAYRQLQTDRERTDLRIRDLQRTESRLSQEITAYQARVEGAPMVEQELTSLTREYQLEKGQYAALSDKHRAAVLAEDLERKRGGEQFAVLYAASLPSAPSSPNQLRIVLLALALGFGLGAALVVIREYLDRSVYDPRALEQRYGLPVLGELPRVDQAA